MEALKMEWELIAGVCGGIVLLFTAGEKIYHIIKPAASWKKKVDSLQTEIKELQDHTNRDYEALQHIDEILKGIGKGQITMINHMIDGNNVDAMKKTRDDLLDLTNKI